MRTIGQMRIAISDKPFHVSAEFRSPFGFVEKGVKINAAFYRDHIPEAVLKKEWAHLY